jgi:hypothetical protein
MANLLGRSAARRASAHPPTRANFPGPFVRASEPRRGLIRRMRIKRAREHCVMAMPRTAATYRSIRLLLTGVVGFLFSLPRKLSFLSLPHTPPPPPPPPPSKQIIKQRGTSSRDVKNRKAKYPERRSRSRYYDNGEAAVLASSSRLL